METYQLSQWSGDQTVRTAQTIGLSLPWSMSTKEQSNNNNDNSNNKNNNNKTRIEIITMIKLTATNNTYIYIWLEKERRKLTKEPITFQYFIELTMPNFDLNV